jgi:hypothetical protein
MRSKAVDLAISRHVESSSDGVNLNLLREPWQIISTEVDFAFATRWL